MVLRAIRNVLIQVISFLGIGYIFRSMHRKKGPLVRVLAFHDVANKAWFESLVVMMKEEYHIVSPQEFDERDFDPHTINVLLTFDDGYQSWIDVVLPVLTEHGVQGIFFLNSGLVDSATDEPKTDEYMKTRLKRSTKKALTWEGASMLANAGHSIGGHTVTHPNLAELQQEERDTEIVNDKKRTESGLGVILTHFAYPFGKAQYFTESVVQSVKHAGYTHAFTAESGFVPSMEGNRETHQFAIPRTCIENNLSAHKASLWISGCYDVVQYLK